MQVCLNVPRFPGGLAMCGSSVYLDMTRFSADYVEECIREDTLPTLPTEPSTALGDLVAKDVLSGVCGGQPITPRLDEHASSDG